MTLAQHNRYDYAPELVAAHRNRGDEIAGHGRTKSERQSTMAEAEEAAVIARPTAAPNITA